MTHKENVYCKHLVIHACVCLCMCVQVVPGDKLVMINGKSIQGMDARGIARLILGPLGSEVELVFECKNSGMQCRTEEEEV